MKKIYVVFTLILFVILLNFNAYSASAANCAPGELFSTTTGQPCGNVSTTVGCQSGFLFSPVTGQPCTVIIDSPTCPVILYPTFGLGSRGENVRAFQQALFNAGYLAGKIDGIYGKVTDSARDSYFRRCPIVVPPPVSPNAPVISGVSGPQTLDVNQQGTWTVMASDASGRSGALSYAVVWGDEVYYAYGAVNATGTSQLQQSATFTHTYSRAGNYTPRFTVTNSSGQTAQTSLSVNVGNTTSGSLTVLSPNGGENWKRGTTQTINWQDSTLGYYNILLQPTCGSNICTAIYRSPYTIVNGVYGSSYNWSVGNSEMYNSNPIPDGSYLVQICKANSSICDSSNSYFTITSGITTSTPTISSLSPTSGPIGTQVSIYGSGFAATGNRVNFGQLDALPGSFSSNGTNIVFTVPTYSPINGLSVQPGNYPVSVISVDGRSASDSINFTVTGTTTTPLVITTTSPLPNAKVNNPYMLVLHVSPDGMPTNQLSWLVVGGSMPPGLFLSVDSGNEVITGTPTVAGTYSFTLTATIPSNNGISLGSSAVKQFTLTVDSATTTQIPNIISLLPPGCSSSSGWSPTTGESCLSAHVGDTVYITGSNFSPSNYAFFYSSQTGNLITLPTTFISSTRMSFVVPANEPGSHGISLKDSTNTSFQSNAVSLNFIGTTTTTAILTASASASYNGATVTAQNGSTNPTSSATLEVPMSAQATISWAANPTSGTTCNVFYKKPDGSSGNGLYFASGASGSVMTSVGYLPALNMVGLWQFLPQCSNSATNPTTATATVGVNVTASSGKGTCEYAQPPQGYHYEGGQPYPTCGAYLVADGTVMGAQSYTFTLRLMRGSFGTEVMELQKFLNATGYGPLAVDGNFGSTSEAAVVKFQMTNGLAADGVVGAATRALLNR